MAEDQFSPLKEQYEEAKTAVDRMADRRDSIRDQALNMMRVYFIAIAAVLTILGYVGSERLSGIILVNPICGVEVFGLCAPANFILHLLGLTLFSTAFFLILASSGGSRLSARTTGYDIEDTLENDYSTENFLESRLEDFKNRYEVNFTSIRINHLSLSLGVSLALLSGVLSTILLYNILARKPVTGVGFLPIALVLIALIGLIKRLSSDLAAKYQSSQATKEKFEQRRKALKKQIN